MPTTDELERAVRQAVARALDGRTPPLPSAIAASATTPAATAVLEQPGWRRDPLGAPATAGPVPRPRRPLVTQEHIEAVPYGGTFHVPAGALVTPQARQAAVTQRVTLAEGGALPAPRSAAGLPGRGRAAAGIDLRSDTVTQPTPAMREAMYRAEVGDDMYGEDVTINRLEELAAEKLGKEAALFVPSGTMGNTLCLLTHTQRGNEIIIGEDAHAFYYEVAAGPALGGLAWRTIPEGRFGDIPLETIARSIRPAGILFPRTSLIWLENTHSRRGGTVLAPSYIRAVCDLARRHELPVHLDGARIFNAAVALGSDVRDLVAPVDSVMFCVSKGLAAPVGSLVVGTGKFVERARYLRKQLGGGMRQAGILAAAGIISLTQMIDRLAEDHANARTLADGLANVRGVSVDLPTVQTNMVAFAPIPGSEDALSFITALERRGVRFSDLGGGRVRAVTHYGIEAADVQRAIEQVAAELGPR